MVILAPMTTASQSRNRDACAHEATLLHRLAGRILRRAKGWHAVLMTLVPFGYEDDTGFHYGAEPVMDQQSYESTV